MDNPKTRDNDKRSDDARPRGLDGRDKQQADLRNPAAETLETLETLETPERLQRPRRGPLDKDVGRRDQ